MRVTSEGWALRHAPAFQADREIVLAAVTSNGYALQYAPAFQADREIVLVAVTSNAFFALEFAAKELQPELELVLKHCEDLEDPERSGRPLRGCCSASG